ncbi:hypothetical protein ACLBW0_02120 [Enterobacteriaceae bacterium C34A]
MEQTFTPQQEAFLFQLVEGAIEQMMSEIITVIEQTQAKADAEIAREGIVISSHSPANSDFLTAVALERLFGRLHRGDLQLAQRILTMQAKQTGISLHVD